MALNVPRTSLLASRRGADGSHLCPEGPPSHVGGSTLGHGLLLPPTLRTLALSSRKLQKLLFEEPEPQTESFGKYKVNLQR